MLSALSESVEGLVLHLAQRRRKLEADSAIAEPRSRKKGCEALERDNYYNRFAIIFPLRVVKTGVG